MNPTLLKLTAFLLIVAGALTSCDPPVEPVEIEYTISPTSLNFDATGGEAEFTVSFKSPAVVESIDVLDTWCQVHTNSVSPVNVNVIVTVDSHTDKEVRNTSVVVNMKSGETKLSATVEITQEGAEWVLIDDIKWATRNVDMPGTFAATPQDAGMFYQWNRKVGWSATDPLINSNGDIWWNSSATEGNTWEKANDPCPAGWRVPTWFELRSLVNADSEWTTVNGVTGRIFGSDDNSLFLPAAGCRVNSAGQLLYQGSDGIYWSSTTESGPYNYRRYLIFDNTNVNIRYTPSTDGFSVRCVVE